MTSSRRGLAASDDPLPDHTARHRASHISSTGPRGPVVEGEGGYIFAAMPFDVAFDDVYLVAVSSAASQIGRRAVRVDRVMHGGDAVQETQRLLHGADAVVADVSVAEPDVLYEVGYAHAIGKPVVQVCSTPYEQMPFMVRNRETLLYHAGGTHHLGQQLAVYLEALLGRGEHA